MLWTETEDAVLRENFAAGKLYREIAEILGRSKGSVLARARALNLPKRQSHPQRAEKTVGGLTALGTMIPYAEPERPHGGCQWPHGDPRDPDFHMCGAPIVKGPSPYCAEHMAEAWRGADWHDKDRPAPRPELRSDYR